MAGVAKSTITIQKRTSIGASHLSKPKNKKKRTKKRFIRGQGKA